MGEAASDGVVSYTLDHLAIEVAGAPLSYDLRERLLSVSVDDALSLPASFSISFRDPFHDVIRPGRFELGSEMTLALHDGTPLLSGAEITTRECEIDPLGRVTTVRGFDLSHRLHRGRRTEVYKDVRYSDVASKIAARTGLGGGTIETPRMAVRPYVIQSNTSDWDFLSRLAAEVGFELELNDGKLCFGPRTPASSAPASVDSGGTSPRQLTLDKLTNFRCAVSGAQQVRQVEVRGWDPRAKRAVVGSARVATTASSLSDGPAAAAGGLHGETLSSIDKLYATQTDADGAARALADEVGSTFGTFEALSRGNPALRAGVSVSIGLAGEFEGKYTLTSTRHTFDEEGYQTWFASNGAHESTLLGLVSNDGERVRTDGVVPAIVSDIRDPDKLGRVKITYPWLSDTNESYWARVAQPWVGHDYGAVFLPEVNDEVLVAFEQGDFGRPYVVGGLYNGQDKPATDGNPLVDDASGMLNVRRMTSRKKHGLDLVDKFGAEGIFVRTGDGKNAIELDVANTRIVVKTNGSVSIEGPQGVKVTSTAGSIELSANDIKLDANAIKIASKGALAIESKGVLEMKSSGIAVLQGSLVKIN